MKIRNHRTTKIYPLILLLFITSHLDGQSIINGGFEDNTFGICEFQMPNSYYNSKITSIEAFSSIPNNDILKENSCLPLGAPNQGQYNGTAEYLNQYNGTTGYTALAFSLDQEVTLGEEFNLTYYDKAVLPDGTYLLGTVRVGISNTPNDIGTLIGTSNSVQDVWNQRSFTFTSPFSGVVYITVTVNDPGQTNKRAVVHLDDFELTPTSPGQWSAQTSGTSNTLVEIDFVDLNNGWAVGSSGTIIHTSDGGANWSGQTSGTSNFLVGLAFTDLNNGWAVGNSGTIKHTSNGGTTWTSQTSGTSNTIVAVSFINSNLGWTAGNSGTIRHTSNGGSSWSGQTSGTTVTLRGVFFTDANTGWAVGDGGVIKTTSNGGTTWTTQTSGTSNPLYRVFFLNSSTGWAVGTGGTILKTINGGSTWTAQTSGISSILRGVHFVDSSLGWANGNSGVILYTTDGGSTWEAQSSGTALDLKDIHFVNSNTGWAVGSSGTLLIGSYNNALPVELISFQGEAAPNGNHLTWRTASEETNDGFEIQRSKGALDWERIGFVEGKGTTANFNSYEFIDNAPLIEQNYYRLKQIDLDGKFEYSKIVSVYFMEKNKVSIFPNPTSGKLEIIGEELEGSAIKILDTTGRLIRSLILSGSELDISDLPNGLYFIQINQKGQLLEVKVIKN